MKHYLESIDNVCADAQSSVDGLSSQQAQERLEKDGKNKLAEGKKEPIILRFLKQFIEPMTLILIVAAIISGVLTAVNNASSAVKEFPSDVIIIMAVVIINAILGVAQESKAEKAIDALQKIAAATSKVIRDGKIVVVKSNQMERKIGRSELKIEQTSPIPPARNKYPTDMPKVTLCDKVSFKSPTKIPTASAEPTRVPIHA